MFNTTIWDYWADKYEKLWVQKYSLIPTRKAIINALSSILDNDRKYKILDMGCGTGQLLREIRASFKDFNIECTGVDISHKMIEMCKLRDSEAFYFTSGIEDFKSLGGEFDIIICSHSFPYYTNKSKAIEKFFSLLKKDGTLVLAQASANNLYDNIAMFFVKFTTSKAEYPSIPGILELVKNRFREIRILKIKEKVYMPTICVFLLGKGEKS